MSIFTKDGWKQLQPDPTKAKRRVAALSPGYDHQINRSLDFMAVSRDKRARKAVQRRLYECDQTLLSTDTLERLQSFYSDCEQAASVGQ